MSVDDRRDVGMKRWRRKWLVLALATLVVLALYEAAHFATDDRAFEIETDRTGKAICKLHGGHTICGEPLPEWAEPLFSFAEWIDGLIGRSPPDRAKRPTGVIYDPAPPPLNSRAKR